MKITRKQLRKIIREIAMHDAGVGGSLSMDAAYNKPTYTGPTPPVVHSLGTAMSGGLTDAMITPPGSIPEADDADESDVEELTEEDYWEDENLNKDAFLDSMVEMWVDHFGLSGIERASAIHALGKAYEALSDIDNLKEADFESFVTPAGIQKVHKSQLQGAGDAAAQDAVLDIGPGGNFG